MSHVLVVDDDVDFVKVVSKVLQKAGHEVTSARNGEQALEMMHKKVPDLVLLDMMMSYILDGLDVRRAMTEDPLSKGRAGYHDDVRHGCEGGCHGFYGRRDPRHPVAVQAS